MERIVETPFPSVGLVLGTYGAVPYVHLQLESHRRLHPHIPFLVHDDCSPVTEQVEALCNSYKVSFYRPPERLSHQEGDLSASIRGMEFGRNRNVEIMVKVSRTYVPLTSFVPHFQRVAFETQYATYSNVCRSCGYGFKTECVGWHLPTYTKHGYFEIINEALRRRSGYFNFVEAYLHTVAHDLMTKHSCEANRFYRQTEVREHPGEGYGVVPWMGPECRDKQPNMLWHRVDQPIDYYRLSLIYGLPYTLKDFENVPY